MPPASCLVWLGAVTVSDDDLASLRQAGLVIGGRQRPLGAADRAVLRFDASTQGPQASASAAACLLYDLEGSLLLSACRSLGRMGSCTAEYQALAMGLELARRTGVLALEAQGDARVVIDQVRGHARARRMRSEHDAISALAAEFEDICFSFIPRRVNEEANALCRSAIAADSWLHSARIFVATDPRTAAGYIKTAHRRGFAVHVDAWAAFLVSCCEEGLAECPAEAAASASRVTDGLADETAALASLGSCSLGHLRHMLDASQFRSSPTPSSVRQCERLMGLLRNKPLLLPGLHPRASL